MMFNSPASEYQLKSGQKIYYRLITGKGIPLIFINGLSDSMDSWETFSQHLESGRTRLYVDLLGQGLTLDQNDSQHDISYKLSVDDQVFGLKQLLNYLNFEKYGVVGFSYGGGVAIRLGATFPQELTELILISPFIVRLDLAFPWARFWLWQFEFAKKLSPAAIVPGYEMIENAYERFVDNYMNYRFERQVPDPIKRRVAIDLSHGIMQYNAFSDFNRLPNHLLHLITSGSDTLVPQSLFNEFWHRLPNAKKVSWTHFRDGEHLILQQNPKSLAKVINRILSGSYSGESRITTDEIDI